MSIAAPAQSSAPSCGSIMSVRIWAWSDALTGELFEATKAYCRSVTATASSRSLVPSPVAVAVWVAHETGSVPSNESTYTTYSRRLAAASRSDCAAPTSLVSVAFRTSAVSVSWEVTASGGSAAAGAAPRLTNRTRTAAATAARSAVSGAACIVVRNPLAWRVERRAGRVAGAGVTGRSLSVAARTANG